ncbi:hypothetical protein BAUCODRAFT_114322 [Baudoinia panamericana UAMH 10762]|uniref:AAA+ ATPase domain-containing protein n=1 Tax=Baudoinia panamericana (strain UAMH 10762) TaxID=717646 RepID=M2N1R1_BAUPA|nr:uncharacterized protein BAUCODRAFT_114322 [Baudoinia panamericana UAMH 10762]EMC92580.1 hypothetical protein BAUCODRAFT_114322 [Baudoinia panamericana UAMH 10762]
MDSGSFVVRTLLPAGSLEGAFRVHLTPDSLDKLDLKVGEICHVDGENGSIGYGIAWRATDKMGTAPKLKPAKMTDTMRTAFGFKEGSHVSISKTKQQIAPATRIILSDVTPTEYANDPTDDDDRWGVRAHFLLSECEAIAVGTTFDVSAKRARRKRFFIDHIECPTVPDGPGLFSCLGRTEVIISTDSANIIGEATLSNEDQVHSVFDISRIGGLVEQAKQLNERLDWLLERASSKPRHILLHGYEGTGKSLLLNSIHTISDCRVTRLVPEGTIAKTQSHIQTVFENAVAKQPSIILIDDADEMLAPDNKAVALTLGTEMDKLRDSDAVLVIGAARSPGALHSKLHDRNRFSVLIELTIPDMRARREIIQLLLKQPDHRENTLGATVASKTHGFTGRDLAFLVDDAKDLAHRRRRAEQDREDWVDVHARGFAQEGTPLTSQVDGSLHSQATTQVEQAPLANGHAVRSEVTFDDFALALKTAKPSALRELFFETPNIKWSDIGGSDAIRERFDVAIGRPLHHADVLAEYRIKPAKGILLYGPPGCSKTMTAQAVATMYDLNFIAIKGAELISMYVGESERSLREIFRKAKQAAPCIIFFDEIDAIGSQREGDGHKGLNVVTTLLTEMDGFETLRDVIVLAATNKPHILDPALLRPGRFDTYVYVGPPNDLARKQILEMSLLTASGASLAPAADVEELVGATAGYSGAEIVRMCNIAKMSAVDALIASGQEQRSTEASGSVSAEQLRSALREVPRGITREMLEEYERFASR